MRLFISFILLTVSGLWGTLTAQDPARMVLDLNGDWDFEQTADAFPPEIFSRKCPVPGLIHLARPRIDQYDMFFNRPENTVADQSHNLMNMDYKPKYSWYRRKIQVPAGLDQQEAVLTIKKSQYVTQVFVNGMDVGQSMACYTPVEFNVTDALRFGEENEILIRVGDRAWLPSQAAGSTDKEKIHYLPGIWDDVKLSFTGKLRIRRALILPSVADRKVSFKIQVRSFYPSQMEYGDPMIDSCRVLVSVFDPETDRVIGSTEKRILAKRDNISEFEEEIALNDFIPWSPDQPKLYVARISLRKEEINQDEMEYRFGMRDFSRQGKYFYLNGTKTYLRGTNITLQRFF